MYEVIVLGATFLAAGIAYKYKKKCLILEPRVQAGYEFFGALNFGVNYDKEIKCGEALPLLQSFLDKNGSFYGCDAYIYPYLKESNTVFGAHIVSVDKINGGFLCTTHGVDGFCSYEAKTVVDTRCSADICDNKTYNMLIESENEPAFSGISFERVGGEKRYVLRCPVPISFGYAEARRAVMGVIQDFSEDQRLILLANEFDYHVKNCYPKNDNGILLLPSKLYENPALAFEAGYCVKEVTE